MSKRASSKCKADFKGRTKLAKAEQKHKQELEASTRSLKGKGKLQIMCSEIRFEVMFLQVKCRFNCSLLGQCCITSVNMISLLSSFKKRRCHILGVKMEKLIFIGVSLSSW